MQENRMHKTNHCFLIGNLGADPVERGRSDKTGSVVGFPIAENVRAFDKETGEYKTVHTNWFHVTAFGSLAERVKGGLKKGDRIAVQGQIKSSRYTDKAGEEKNGFEIIAEDVGLWQPLAAAAAAPQLREAPGRIAVKTGVKSNRPQISPATQRRENGVSIDDSAHEDSLPF
jgi:single stranded DNA-binding protein